MSNEEFISMMKDIISGECAGNRIIPSILIAHAAVTSKWGKSDIALHANNLYHVQCKPELVDNYYEKQEIIQTGTGKQTVSSTRYYRIYSSWKESIIDYIARLTMKENYNVVGTQADIEGCVKSYAYVTTRDKYNTLENKILAIIHKYNLNRFDSMNGKYNPYALAQVGDHGEIVKWTQYELAKAGYCVNSDEYNTGFFDYHLMIKLSMFQSDHGLEPTGIVDLKTLKTLESCMNW